MPGSGAALRDRSWVELLRHRVQTRADALAYRFLRDGEQDEVTLTYGDLDRRARALAVSLRTHAEPGDRALLLYPPGLEFIAALAACWYAGLTPVPCRAPKAGTRAGRSIEARATAASLGAIANDCTPRLALTVSQLVTGVNAALAGAVNGVRTIATDDIDDGRADAWAAPQIDEHTIACLQYTSGSTGAPRGVVLSHANMLHASETICRCFGHTLAGQGVIWLPHYHDMGLVGGILQPLFVGSPVTLMAPTMFLQRPRRWLEAITRFGGTTSGGPNFAYEHCLRSIAPADRRGLDLSTWEVAFTGAEPVRASTLDAFAEAFGPCGFRREMFYPCYGLAEATLLVTGGQKDAAPRRKRVNAAALAQHRVEDHATGRAKTFVSCGSASGCEVVIADPATGQRVAEGRIGEVWVRGASVARGYWNRENDPAFGASLAGEDASGGYLRTGDLGFLDGGELFITGRLKDMLILRGVNHYPQDIELTAYSSHPSLQPESAAAFAVPADDQAEDSDDELVVLQELKRGGEATPEVFTAMLTAIADEHGLSPRAILLLAPGQVPRTSSGKIRRQACRQMFADGAFTPIARWDRETQMAAGDAPAATPPQGLAGWLCEQLAKELDVPLDHVDPAEPLVRYGLDSASAIGLACRIEGELGVELPATLFWDYPTIEGMATYLERELGVTAPQADAAASMSPQGSVS